MEGFVEFLQVLPPLFLFWGGFASAKQCANTFLLFTHFEARALDDVQQRIMERRDVLSLPTDDYAWSSLLPRKVLREEDEFSWAQSPHLRAPRPFCRHYMSAAALMWASTHNDTLKERMSAEVSALFDCQKKTGTRYLSAFPSQEFDRFEALKPVWAPYYTIHKVNVLLMRIPEISLIKENQPMSVETAFITEARFVHREMSIEKKKTRQ